jgi:hypothetical protein
MMDKQTLFWIGLLFWGMFLVLIATFGGDAGQLAAGVAGGISAFLLYFWFLIGP